MRTKLRIEGKGKNLQALMGRAFAKYPNVVGFEKVDILKEEAMTSYFRNLFRVSEQIINGDRVVFITEIDA